MNFAWLITAIVLGISAITVLSRIADALSAIAVAWIQYLNTVLADSATPVALVPDEKEEK